MRSNNSILYKKPKIKIKKITFNLFYFESEFGVYENLLATHNAECGDHGCAFGSRCEPYASCAGGVCRC